MSAAGGAGGVVERIADGGPKPEVGAGNGGAPKPVVAKTTSVWDEVWGFAHSLSKKIAKPFEDTKGLQSFGKIFRALSSIVDESGLADRFHPGIVNFLNFAVPFNGFLSAFNLILDAPRCIEVAKKGRRAWSTVSDALSSSSTLLKIFPNSVSVLKMLTSFKFFSMGAAAGPVGVAGSFADLVQTILGIAHKFFHHQALTAKLEKTKAKVIDWSARHITMSTTEVNRWRTMYDAWQAKTRTITAGNAQKAPTEMHLFQIKRVLKERVELFKCLESLLNKEIASLKESNKDAPVREVTETIAVLEQTLGTIEGLKKASETSLSHVRKLCSAKEGQDLTTEYATYEAELAKLNPGGEVPTIDQELTQPLIALRGRANVGGEEARRKSGYIVSTLDDNIAHYVNEIKFWSKLPVEALQEDTAKFRIYCRDRVTYLKAKETHFQNEIYRTRLSIIYSIGVCLLITAGIALYFATRNGTPHPFVPWNLIAISTAVAFGGLVKYGLDEYWRVAHPRDRGKQHVHRFQPAPVRA